MSYCNPKVLIASHIVPWKDCNRTRSSILKMASFCPQMWMHFSTEHLISFSDEGQIMLGQAVTAEDLGRLGISPNAVIPVTAGMVSYLRRHRELLK